MVERAAGELIYLSDELLVKATAHILALSRATRIAPKSYILHFTLIHSYYPAALLFISSDRVIRAEYRKSRMPHFNSIIVILSLLKLQPHRLCFPTTSQPAHDPRLHSPVTRLGAHYLFYLHILHTAGPSSCRPSCSTWLPAGSKSSALTAHVIVVPWLLEYTDIKRTRNMGL